MHVFRASLLALIPVLQQARIPVGVHPGVDAWDEISELLFHQLVEETIRHALPTEEKENFSLPTYEMDCANYHGRSFICVTPRHEGLPAGETLVFHSFDLSDGPESDLSQILCRRVDCDGQIVADDWKRLFVLEVEFSCEVQVGSLRQRVGRMCVPL